MLAGPDPSTAHPGAFCGFGGHHQNLAARWPGCCAFCGFAGGLVRPEEYTSVFFFLVHNDQLTARATSSRCWASLEISPREEGAGRRLHLGAEDGAASFKPTCDTTWSREPHAHCEPTQSPARWQRAVGDHSASKGGGGSFTSCLISVWRARWDTRGQGEMQGLPPAPMGCNCTHCKGPLFEWKSVFGSIYKCLDRQICYLNPFFTNAHELFFKCYEFFLQPWSCTGVLQVLEQLSGLYIQHLTFWLCFRAAEVMNDNGMGDSELCGEQAKCDRFTRHSSFDAFLHL